jgi:hypothetical protein
MSAEKAKVPTSAASRVAPMMINRRLTVLICAASGLVNWAMMYGYPAAGRSGGRDIP